MDSYNGDKQGVWTEFHKKFKKVKSLGTSEITYKDEETRRIKAVARCEEEIAEEKEIKKVWQKERSEALPPPQ